MVRIRTKALMFSMVLVTHWSLAALAQESYSGDPSLPFTDSGAGVAHFEAFDSYLRFSHLMGDAIGHTSNYTQLGAFTPFFQDRDRLWFVDAQMIATNDSRLAANLGYGVRQYVEEWDRLFGFSVWYDVDDGRDVTLHQTGLSLETYGPWGDLRLNVDLPMTTRTKTRFTSLTNTRFSGGNILSDRTRIDTTALDHIELMIGGAIPLPWMEDPSLRGYMGYYYLDGPDSPSANGILGRLEGYTTPDLSFHFTVRNDAINKTSALFGLTWVFPGRSTSRGSTTYDPARRLALPVARDYRVAVNHVETMQTIVAMSSSSMAPITVAHVDSSAAAGTGTFESPFSSFTDLAGSGGSFDLIVVAADSVFNNESITLTDNQRLLGQAPGLLHQVDTAMGTLTLPTSSGTMIPMFMNTMGNAITLANNNEVSGFNVQGSTGSAIFGTGISGFNIRNTVIGMSSGDGILLQSVSGVGQIMNSTIDQNGQSGPTFGSGVEITSAAAGTLNLTVDTITFNGNGTTPEMPTGTNVGGDGLTLLAQGSAAVNLTITNNTFTNNGAPIPPAGVTNTSGGAVVVTAGSGLNLSANGSATINGTVNNNQILTNGCFGGGITNTSGSITVIGGSGLLVNSSGSSSVQLAVTNNTINGNGFFGDLINNSTNLTVVGGSGIMATVADASTSLMNLTVNNNVVGDNGFVMSALNSGTSMSATGGFGISLVDGSSSLSTFTVTNNALSRNGTVSMLMGGVTSTPGSNLIGELTNAASVACFDINGNSFDADYMLDNQSGGVFQVIDLNNLGTNNSGAMPTFAPGILSFTDTPSH